MSKDYRELFEKFLYEVSTENLNKGLGRSLLNKKGNSVRIDYPPEVEPLIKVTISNLVRALDLVSLGTVTPEQLQDWANIIYMCDDVFEIDSKGSEERTELLKTLLQEISTPEINEPLTPEFIAKTRKQLEPYL